MRNNYGDLYFESQIDLARSQEEVIEITAKILEAHGYYSTAKALEVKCNDYRIKKQNDKT